MLVTEGCAAFCRTRSEAMKNVSCWYGVSQTPIKTPPWRRGRMLRSVSGAGSAAFDRLTVHRAVLQHDVVFLAVGFNLLQANQQEVVVLGEPHHGNALVLRRITHALDLDGIDRTHLG